MILKENEKSISKIANGIWKITLGDPEKNTPVSILENEVREEALRCLECKGIAPFLESDIEYKKTDRGVVVSLPMKTSENIYGFGLQLYSVNHSGKKKCIRVNSDPIADTGDSHAPVPFYVSSSGYGVYVDTARYVSFYCGTSIKKGSSKNTTVKRKEHEEFSETSLYALKRSSEDREVVIHVPHVEGIDIYLFEGPELKTAVQRYNLFSGGGFVPPLWGLGMWYRTYGGSTEEDVYRLAEDFRTNKMPVDVLGLEPGWQSHSYSCSYKWDNIRFPFPEKMIKDMNASNYKINLWEHAFVHPSADIYKDLMDYSGEYEVWNGLVPDFNLEEAREIFANYHEKELVDKGVMGFKLDECDSSDFKQSSWSFPDVTEFPSGLDGEQMHNVIGQLYQKTIASIFEKRNMRTLSQVRSSGALAPSLPFVLYSDLYKHKEFIRGVVNIGFSGLMWSPEVRQASSPEDLIRRIQTVIFSPHALLNCWRIPNPPWMQVDREKNISGEFLENFEEVRNQCRKLFELRMSLLPYLYSAFSRYYFEGLPPFRALVMDYPEEPETWYLDNQYMMGESIMVAPVIDGEYERKVYLPKGEWVDFWTGERVGGEYTYDVQVSIDRIPVYVKAGTLLPLAKPVEYITKDTVFDITVKCYGESCSNFTLYEDDGFTFDYRQGQFNNITLSYSGNGNYQVLKEGNYSGSHYRIIGWEKVGI